MVPETIHASCAVLGGQGVLIRGASGSGKSSLLAALMAGTPPARLVADDRVVVSVVDGCLFAAPPPRLAGLIEVRGAGLLRFPYAPQAEICLLVDLVAEAECPRLPDADEASETVSGVAIRRMWLPVGMADGASRVRLVLASMGQGVDLSR